MDCQLGQPVLAAFIGGVLVALGAVLLILLILPSVERRRRTTR